VINLTNLTKVLAIDTSGQQACAAVVDNYITISEILLTAKTGERSWTHSEILMPGIDSMLNLSGLRMEDIDYVAYTSGPGSFTGLRIGAATALGISRGLNKPVIAVPTLDALVHNVSIEGKIAVPMMDARRNQVYFAIYDGVRRVTDYLALPVGEVLDKLEELSSKESSIIFLGDGADAYRKEISERMPNANFARPNINRLRASAVGAWALEHLDTARSPVEEAEILYIRAPQAVRDAAKS